MAFAGLGTLISAQQNSSTSSWSPAPSAQLNAGELGIVIGAVDNIDSVDCCSINQVISDSVGNLWQRIDDWEYSAGAANAGAECSVWWTVATTNLTTGGTITMTLQGAARTAKSMIGYRFSLGTDFIGVEAYARRIDSAADAGSLTLSSLRNAEHLIIRGMATESATTTFTPSTNYTSFGTPTGSAGAMCARGEFRIVTATTDTTDSTTVSADQSSIMVSLREIAKSTHAVPHKLLSYVNASNLSAYTSTTLTASATEPIIAWVRSEKSTAGTPNVPTFTGGGLTWTQKATQDFGTSRLTVYSAQGPQSAPATLGADFAGQTQTNIMIGVLGVTNGGSVIQAVAAAANTATLAAFAKSSNCGLAVTFRNSFSLTEAQGNGPDTTVTDWQWICEDYVADTYGHVDEIFWAPDDSNRTFTQQATTNAPTTILLEIDNAGSRVAALASTLGAVTIASTAAAAVQATLAVTLGDVTASSVALEAVHAALAVTLGAVTSSSTAAVAVHAALAKTLGAVTILSTALSTLRPGASRSIAVPSLASAFLPDVQAITKRWFRNGVVPPAAATRKLADRLNMLLARRRQVLFSHANTYGLHTAFDSGVNTDLTTWRVAFRTGPVTKRVRARLLMLPLPSATSISSDAYCQWVMTTGLTGAGSSVTEARAVVSSFSLTSGLDADEMFQLEQEWDVAPSATYRLELHQVNRARVVSGVVYEVPRDLLSPDTDICVDPAGFYIGGPIVQPDIETLMKVADTIWRHGHPLGSWCHDLPADALTRTSATPANLWDQTALVTSAVSLGWPVSRPFSGTLYTSDVPVTFWAHAGCASGTGSLELRDQDDNVIATLAPAGAADWLATTCNLTDASGSPETSKLDVFVAGDGANATTVNAVGVFMAAAT